MSVPDTVLQAADYIPECVNLCSSIHVVQRCFVANCSKRGVEPYLGGVSVSFKLLNRSSDYLAPHLANRIRLIVHFVNSLRYKLFRRLKDPRLHYAAPRRILSATTQ